MEYWVEVNVGLNMEMDEFLCKYVSPLIRLFKKQWLTWFFFREPDLRLRFEWRNKKERETNNKQLFSILEYWRESGRISYWYQGCHGRRGKVYRGEADLYGKEIWPPCKKDWMIASEFALVFLKFKSEDKLTKSFAFHWSRHVHLFTNHFVWSHADEVMLCLRQALKYINKMQNTAGRDAVLADKIKNLVEEAIGEEKSLREASKKLDSLKCYLFDQP